MHPDFFNWFSPNYDCISCPEFVEECEYNPFNPTKPKAKRCKGNRIKNSWTGVCECPPETYAYNNSNYCFPCMEGC